MSRRYQYDYYTVHVPGKAFDTNEELAHCAVNQAREAARLYCLPRECEWEVTRLRGEPGDYEVVFRVRRKRNKILKRA